MWLTLAIFFAAILGTSIALQCHTCGPPTVSVKQCQYDFKSYQPQNCTNDQPYCMVERWNINGKVQKFIRRCEKMCKPMRKGGEERFGEHRSCCQTDLCNTDNSAPKVVTIPSEMISLLSICAIPAFLAKLWY
ncbi:ly-6/neurotoxin-like protein 1 [Tubulanus polymorphus]|uniref:ly-6/neurotoxin-like protein 1 n=1 Tax=Tubulanus polymorphus TaxID=672921 RepID=UPI003DA49FD8